MKNDLRYAIRSLLKQRGFTAVAVLTLAIALGANTAIFSVVNAILLRPLPFSDPERLVTLDASNRLNGNEYPVYSYPNYVDVRKQSKTLEVAAFNRVGAFLMEGSEPEPMAGLATTENLFAMLGVRPQLGRVYTPAEDRQGGAKVIVLTHELWARKFASDRGVIGRQIRYGTAGDSRTVIGVLKPGFRFPAGETQRDFFIPFEENMNAAARESRDSIWINLVGKLRGNATLTQANAELDAISRRLAAQYPNENTGAAYHAKSMHEEIVREVRPAVLLLFGAVGLVLLIGCANVANLLLARATGRQKEISIRAAVGATRTTIVRQLLIESVVLSFVSGAIGLLLAAWGIDILLALAPEDIPRLESVSLDASVLLFSAALSLLTGIIFGLAPAFSASKPDLTEALKDATRGSTVGRKTHRMRSALVVAAVALSLVLLVGAGLLLRSFMAVTAIDPGYDYRNAVELRISPRTLAYPKQEEARLFHDRLLAALRAMPGVEAAGAASALPLSPNENIASFDVVGQPLSEPGQTPAAKYLQVTPGFFDAAAIRLLRGRDVTTRDTSDKPDVVVINESFAHRFFPGQNPLGKRLLFDRELPQETVEIVGVVSDVRWRDAAEEAPSTMFFPYAQSDNGRALSYLVRSPNANTLAPALRSTVRQLDREQPITNIEPLIQTRAESLEARRFNLILLGMLAALALLLAGVGIYSVMSYAVTQRTSEIGIRMALGAQAGDVFRLIVGQAVKLVVIGLGAGVVIALGASRVMRSLLYGISPTDPWTYVAICTVIGSIALIASYLPAARAAKVDPLVAIRYD